MRRRRRGERRLPRFPFLIRGGNGVTTPGSLGRLRVEFHLPARQIGGIDHMCCHAAEPDHFLVPDRRLVVLDSGLGSAHGGLGLVQPALRPHAAFLRTRQAALPQAAQQVQRPLLRHDTRVRMRCWTSAIVERSSCP